MEYLFDLKFEDPGYNAIVHLVYTLNVSNDNEARIFYKELISSFKRENVNLFLSNFYRIDIDQETKDSIYQYLDLCFKRATASIKIKQYILKDPDQSKSLADNLIQKLLAGEDSTARYGNQYNIPVRVTDKKTREPISGEFYYFNIEHLIQKK